MVGKICPPNENCPLLVKVFAVTSFAVSSFTAPMFWLFAPNAADNSGELSPCTSLIAAAEEGSTI